MYETSSEIYEFMLENNRFVKHIKNLEDCVVSFDIDGLEFSECDHETLKNYIFELDTLKAQYNEFCEDNLEYFI